MQIAIEQAAIGMEKNYGGPFGAVIVKGDEIIGTGSNHVTSDLDPTAHAEICAIRQACLKLKDFSLQGCEIYTSCEPCPMCLGAIYWARLDRIYFGATRFDAAKINFDDRRFYEELEKAADQRDVPMMQVMRDDCIKVFDAWTAKTNKVLY
jgi:guanine deaminase